MSPERLGQHFLIGAGWRERVIGAIAPKPNAVWLEIGAGHGEMTTLLACRAKQVIAIELDPPLARRLEEVTAAAGNVRVVSGDVLELDLASLVPLAGAERFHVYGNLPYYITSPILHRLFEMAERIASIHIVVQMEVAERIAARPGRREYGYLSVLAQFHARPEIRLKIPPGAFRPRPRVFSALVSMELPGAGSTLGIADTAAFFEFVKVCFAQKRKTLWNNLRGAVGEERTKIALAAASIEPRTRAEELSVPQFAALYRALP
ncbi:MAG: 16S rRNA (adenine(1518)-N(6)/adenine(1519)-N(6))-dimethyltransferase RsmA [Candidatus Acidiferrales bacterium]